MRLRGLSGDGWVSKRAGNLAEEEEKSATMDCFGVEQVDGGGG
jgi:hypothetical protein